MDLIQASLQAFPTLYFRIWFIALAILIVSIDLRHFFMYEEAIH